MFRLTEQVLLALLSFSGSLATKCITLNNHACMTRPMLINLTPDTHNQKLGYFQFMVILGRCDGSCNIFDDLSSKMYFPNKFKCI